MCAIIANNVDNSALINQSVVTVKKKYVKIKLNYQNKFVTLRS